MSKITHKFLNWLGFYAHKRPAPSQMMLEKTSHLKVLIERHPNPEMTTFHFSHNLGTPEVDFSCYEGEIRVNREVGSRNIPIVPSRIWQLVERLYAINGVEDGRFMEHGVAVGPHEVHVRTGRVVDHDEVEQAVITAIAKAFKLKSDQVEVAIEDSRGAHPTYAGVYWSWDHDDFD